MYFSANAVVTCIRRDMTRHTDINLAALTGNASATAEANDLPLTAWVLQYLDAGM